MPRWPWSRREKAPVNPDAPHRFQSSDDPGIGAMVAGGGYPGPPTSQVAATRLTSEFAQASRCRVPGCERDRSDPIHNAG